MPARLDLLFETRAPNFTSPHPRHPSITQNNIPANNPLHISSPTPTLPHSRLTTMDPSPLSHLPRELRDLIYEFTFTPCKSDQKISLLPGVLHIDHPLTKTCTQIRRETLSLYYSMTCFNAHLQDGPPTPLVGWMRRIGPELVLGVREVNVWVSSFPLSPTY